jgi:hypothetical protein
MGCNCKTKDAGSSAPTNKKHLTHKNLTTFLSYTAKIIGFLIMIVLLPLINLVIIWFIFNTLVLTKDVDVKGLIQKLMLRGKDDDDDDDDDDEDDDFEDLTEDDVIMIDVEDITQNSK